MAPEMKDKIQFDYDEQADVLSAVFGTGEPSYSEEVDDFLILDVGIYSGTPTGFQVLHIREIGVAKVKVVLKKVLRQVKSREEETRELLLSNRNRLFRDAIKRVQPETIELVEA